MVANHHQFVAEGAKGELAVAAEENLRSLARGESTEVLAKVDFQV